MAAMESMAAKVAEEARVAEARKIEAARRVEAQARAKAAAAATITVPTANELPVRVGRGWDGVGQPGHTPRGQERRVRQAAFE
eukprot:364286-Chlamydomonas_euryale.AAC.3